MVSFIKMIKGYLCIACTLPSLTPTCTFGGFLHYHAFLHPSTYFEKSLKKYALFLCFVGGRSQVKGGFTQSTVVACEDACTQTKTFLLQMECGDITVGQFKTVWKDVSYVKKLALAMDMLPLAENINTNLQKWNKEIELLEIPLENLSHFLDFIPPQVHGKHNI